MNLQQLLSAIPSSNDMSVYLGRVAESLGRLVVDPVGGLRRSLATALRDAYASGFCGCFVNSPESPQWARNIAVYTDREFRDLVGANAWTVEQTMPQSLQGTGKGKRALNWQYAQKVNPKFYAGNQDFGNCTSWMTREKTITVAGMAIAKGELHRLDHRHGTALVYGSRGTSSQGMSLGTAMRAVTTIGQSEEKDYGNGLDLSTEAKDESAGNSWGRSGVPQALKDAVKGDTIQKAWKIDSPTADVIRDIFWNEGVIGHGSNRTAANSRNGLISGLTSIGGHAQAAIGYDDTDEFREWAAKELGVDLKGDGVVIHDQSWGDWLDLSKWPSHLWGPRPEGAWVTTIADCLAILRNWGDGWAMTGINGFQARSLPNWGTSTYLGD